MRSGTFGRSVERVEDRALLRGEARFIDDIVLPGMLHAAFVRSPFAHATINAVVTTAARAMPGVHAVLTLGDIAPQLATTRLVVALPSPAYRQELHRPVLADGEVVHVGEAIAIVLAEDRYLAEDAAAAVEIDYDQLPVISDCKAGLESGAPTVHRDGPHNLAGEFTLQYGDTDRVFASAPHIFREQLWQHRGGSHSMECRGAIASFDSLEDRLTLWSSTQTPHAARRHLSEVLGRDEASIRVVAPDVGGGFGPKLVFYPEDACLAAAALLLQRPVKWIEDRREHFIGTTQERDQYWDVEIAVDEQGRLLGVRGRVVHEHGAYTARGMNVPYNSGSAMPLAYVVPAYKLDVQVALTNKVPVTPLRGAGQPQGVFAMERLLDRAARELGLDRAEIRRRNLIQPEHMPYTLPLRTRGGMQVVLDGGDYAACQRDALIAAGWKHFPERQAAARAQGRYIGIGIANYVEGTGRGPYEQVRVQIQSSGKVHVYSGATGMGQGTKTMLAQIVAEQLGRDMTNIVVVAGDTDAVPLGFGAFNSRQAAIAGPSAHSAAVVVRKKALTMASHLIGVPESELDIDGTLVGAIASNRRISLGELARAAQGLPGFFLPGGLTPGLEATEQVVIDNMAYSNGSAVVTVEVNIETAAIRLTDVVLAHDCGRLIHPKIVDGQLIGGIAHGVGNALFEEMLYDANAQPVTTTLAEYLLVTATEMPQITLLHRESRSPLNELGVKGVGESGVLPITAATASAIEDALAPF